MRSLVFVVPGSIETRTGGYEYDRRMIAGLREQGWTIDVRELDASFPRPTPAALNRAADVLASIPNGATVIVDGLAFGAMPDLVCREASRLRFVALVHMPLAHEAGLDARTAAQLEAGERRALGAATRVVATGHTTVPTLIDYGIAADRIALVEPGTDPAPPARGSSDPTMPHLVCVATLNAGKGHDVLFGSLARLRHQAWRLTCAGSLDRDPETVGRLRATLRDAGLDDRVTLAGALEGDALSGLYDSGDLFVLASRRETYGMAVVEALARGLPVVATRTGAIARLVGEGPEAAGLLVDPGDEAALAGALSALLGDAHLRARLRSAACRVRAQLPTWPEAAGTMAKALDG